jgi:hypothetical protein
VPGGEYDARGWIRVERALAASLNSPRAWKAIPPEAFATLVESGDKPPDTEWWLLEDPATGQATMEGDRRYLAALSALALKLWPVGYESNWRSQGNTYKDWGYQPTLEYGSTKIFTWCMNYYAGGAMKGEA